MNDILPFKNSRVLVVGDVMLDAYYIGEVNRISPEAPIPVVNVCQTYNTLGGAANVANNVASLNASVCLAGCAGNDSNRFLLEELALSSNIKTHLIPVNYPTITKTRVLAGNQQIVRLDFETIYELGKSEIQELETIIRRESVNYDIFILSDYGKGCCHPYICKLLVKIAYEQEKTILIDPKGHNWEKYRGATIITPNIKELETVINLNIPNDDLIISKYGKKIKQKYDLQSLLITRSEKGMTFISEQEAFHFRTEAKEVYDVSGAGDTVVATLSVALSSGLSWKDAVICANKAASIVVEKKGTTPIQYHELSESFKSEKNISKIKTLKEISLLVKKLKNQGKKIIFTNGCFDIVHQGHISYLKQAKALGDVLIIGLNSDTSVKRLKGSIRPIKNEEERAIILEAFSFVDYVTIFEEDTPFELLSLIKPHVLVKGGDYSFDQVVGREFADETILIPFVNGFSSSKDIEKIMVTDVKLKLR